MAIATKNGSTRRGRPVRFPNFAKIELVIHYNPYRDGTKLFHHFNIIKKGDFRRSETGEIFTCGDFFAQGGKTWMLSKYVSDSLIRVPKALDKNTRNVSGKDETAETPETTPATDAPKADDTPATDAPEYTAENPLEVTKEQLDNIEEILGIDNDTPKFGDTKIVTGNDTAETVTDTPDAPETPETTQEDTDADTDTDDAPAKAEIAPEPVEKFIKPSWWKTFVALAKIRQNIMLVGPSGCGKTFLSERLAETLGLPFGMQSCTAGMDESALSGYLLPVGKDNKMIYVSSTFVTLYEKGGVMLLDEFDASEPNTAIFINAAIAGKSFFIPQRIGNERVVKHKDFVCIAAANTFGTGEDEQFVREKLDAATLDRFRAGIIEMNYDAKVERKLTTPQVYAWAKAIRDWIESMGDNCNYIMSTRVMVDFTLQHKVLGWGKAKWEKSYFADWTPEDIRDVRAHIRQAMLTASV